MYNQEHDHSISNFLEENRLKTARTNALGHSASSDGNRSKHWLCIPERCASPKSIPIPNPKQDALFGILKKEVLRGRAFFIIKVDVFIIKIFEKDLFMKRG